MKLAMAACVATALVLGGGSGWAAKTPKSVKVTMETTDGRSAGSAILVNEKNGVKFVVNFENLDPGKHGIHVHQNPKCDAPSFESAGGHFNPFGKEHGYQNPKGHHAGDAPINLTVGDDGKVKQTFLVKDLTLDPNAKNSVFANGGTSLMVHAGPDDMKSNPSGNSGAREACGIISIDNASQQDMSAGGTQEHLSSSNN